MTNIDLYPLQDNYESKLSQPYDGTSSVIYVDSIPAATLPGGAKVLFTINPGTSFAQTVEVNGWSAGQLNVSSTTVEKGNGINYSTTSHGAKSPIIISDNFAYWKEIAINVNSKSDIASPVFTGSVGLPTYADTAARNTAIPTPTNAMMVKTNNVVQHYNSATAQREDLDVGTPLPDASTTVAGKVEKATAGEITAGTSTGGTGAELFVGPAELKTVTDGLVTPDASETVKGKIEIATLAETKTGTDTVRAVVSNNMRLSVATIEPGTTITYVEANTERTSSLTSYTKIKEFLVNNTGFYTVSFDLKANIVASSINARIYINGVAVGIVRASSSTTYTTYSENLQVKFGDLVQLYFQSVSGTHAVVRNFNMKYDALCISTGTQNMD